MRVLEDQPVSPHIIERNHSWAFDDNESVDLVLENLSLADETDLWRVLAFAMSRVRMWPG